VIATHDIGAIAYYSERPVVDMVGLVTPEMIREIGDAEGLRKLLAKKHVTHLAVLRNWFEVEDQDPLFQTDPRHPEVMEVFRYGSTTHILSRDVMHRVEAGRRALAAGDFERAASALERATELDPRAGRAHLYLGVAYLNSGRLEEARRELQLAARLHPGSVDVRAAQADLAVRQNRPTEAIALLESVIATDSTYANAYLVLSDLYRSTYRDFVRSARYRALWRQASARSDP
jgi:tetratricopeptide (TPR) repeat protein